MGGSQPVSVPDTTQDFVLSLIAGVDEVGRGALFGPVVAAAVVLTSGARDTLQAMGVADSKQLTPKKREALVPAIKSLAVAWAIGMASVHDIERINILQASLLAMARAIRKLEPQPQLCLIDGNRQVPQLRLPQQTVIQGDNKYVEIGAASILAKVWRDTLLVRLDRRYPGYDLASNKGYGSRTHRLAIQTLGPTHQHRKSFKGCQAEQQSLF